MNKIAVSEIDLAFAPDNAPSGLKLLDANMNLVGHVPVMLSALVGSIGLTLEQLFALKKGEVMAMNESLDTPVTLLLNGKPVARGELVAVEDNFGIRITELS